MHLHVYVCMGGWAELYVQCVALLIMKSNEMLINSYTAATYSSELKCKAKWVKEYDS